jgi:hypothetical protein
VASTKTGGLLGGGQQSPQADVPVTMQGIAVPASSVNAREFFRRTRRLTFAQKTFAFAGLGFTDNVPILQTGGGLMT